MRNLHKIKLLYEKYLNRTATHEEVEELFMLLRDRNQFQHIHNIMEDEWERNDIDFSVENLSWEKVRSEWPTEQRISEVREMPIEKHTIWSLKIRKIVAVAAGVLIAGMMLWWWTKTNTKEYRTGFGETMEIVLSDGSRVLLNANSKMTWNTNWQNIQERTVQLEGEAFFEVSHQRMPVNNSSPDQKDSISLMPFQVITSDLSVNVLGTSFNVASRRQKTDVFLKSGEVLLVAKPPLPRSKNDEKKTAGPSLAKHMDSIYLTPGDHITYSGITRALERHEEKLPDEPTSWVDGFLVYENEKLETVLQELKDIYGKSFIMEDSTMLSRQVDLGLPYEDWYTVSELMSLSLEIEMEENNSEITVKKLEK